MRKLLLVTVLVLTLSAVVVGLASADNGPHGGYHATTDACAGCHRAHTGKGLKLLMAGPTSTDLCFACHGASATGADTNVEDGVYLERDSVAESPAEGTVDNGLRGGGFVNAFMDTDRDGTFTSGPTTSAHTVDGSFGTMWGNGPISPTAYAGPDIRLQCVNCHNPHGGGVYRILRPIPRDSGATTAVAVPDEAEKFYTTSDYMNTTYLPSEISDWCAQCHTRYLAGGGSAEADSGDAIFMYRHTTKPFPLCLSCHVAHGTSAVMTTDGPFSGAVAWPDGSTTPSDDARSSLLRIDNRGVCFYCHGTPP